MELVEKTPEERNYYERQTFKHTPWIIIESQEGQEFIVPQDLAKLSPILSIDLINPILKIDRVVCNLLKGDTLENILRILFLFSLKLKYYKIEDHKDYIFRNIDKDWIKELPYSSKVDLIRASDFLCLTYVKELLAKIISNEIHEAENPQNFLQKLTQDELFVIAKQYLIKNRKPSPLIKVDYPISIQDLRETIGLIFEKPRIKLPMLIQSLNGLAELYPTGKFFNSEEQFFEERIREGNKIKIKGTEEYIYHIFRSIWFNYNHITFIPSNAFEHLWLLEELYLGHNRIAYLDPEVFKTLVYLRKLILDENQIEKFSFEHIKNCPLKFLDLTNNRITDCEVALCEKFKSIENVFIEGNPINNETKDRFTELKKSLPRLVLRFTK